MLVYLDILIVMLVYWYSTNIPFYPHHTGIFWCWKSSSTTKPPLNHRYSTRLRRHLRQRFVFEREDKGRGQQQNAQADDAEKHRHGKLWLHQAAQHRGVDLQQRHDGTQQVAKKVVDNLFVA